VKDYKHAQKTKLILPVNAHQYCKGSGMCYLVLLVKSYREIQYIEKLNSLSCMYVVLRPPCMQLQIET